MPACFTLTRRSDLEAGPVSFITIDEELCAFLGVKCDPIKYYRSWYDEIGFALAAGKDWKWIKKECKDTELEPIADWLYENFDSNAWYERFKR